MARMRAQAEAPSMAMGARFGEWSWSGSQSGALIFPRLRIVWLPSSHLPLYLLLFEWAIMDLGGLDGRGRRWSSAIRCVSDTRWPRHATILESSRSLYRRSCPSSFGRWRPWQYGR